MLLKEFESPWAPGSSEIAPVVSCFEGTGTSTLCDAWYVGTWWDWCWLLDILYSAARFLVSCSIFVMAEVLISISLSVGRRAKHWSPSTTAWKLFSHSSLVGSRRISNSKLKQAPSTKYRLCLIRCLNAQIHQPYSTMIGKILRQFIMERRPLTFMSGLCFIASTKK